MPRSSEHQRAANARRYSAYKTLCAELGVLPDWDRWWKHFTELRSLPAPVVASSRDPEPASLERRLSRAELACWWTERFSHAEIFELARHIAPMFPEEKEAA